MTHQLGITRVLKGAFVALLAVLSTASMGVDGGANTPPSEVNVTSGDRIYRMEPVPQGQRRIAVRGFTRPHTMPVQGSVGGPPDWDGWDPANGGNPTAGGSYPGGGNVGGTAPGSNCGMTGGREYQDPNDAARCTGYYTRCSCDGNEHFIVEIGDGSQCPQPNYPSVSDAPRCSDSAGAGSPWKDYPDCAECFGCDATGYCAFGSVQGGQCYLETSC